MRGKAMIGPALLVTALAALPAAAATHVVDDDLAQCPEAGHRSLQSAINAAANGDTIQVCAGDYPERVYIAKSLHLSGPAAGLDGRARSFGSTGEALVHSPMPFQLFADQVILDGFSIRVELDESLEGQGVFVFGSGYQILNNLIDDGGTAGIVLVTRGDHPNLIIRNHFLGRFGVAADGEGAARNLRIADNRFRNAGLLLVDGPSTAVSIAGNVFEHDPLAPPVCGEPESGCRPSLFLARTQDVDVQRNQVAGSGAYALRALANAGLLIEGNDFTDGDHSGLLLEGAGREVRVLSNRMLRFAGTGVRIAGATGFHLEGNVVEDNGNGLVLDDADNNAVRANVIEDNRGIGLDVLTSSTGNQIDANEVRGHGELDCRDASSGTASFGTANSWTGNEGTTSVPDGLCKDQPA